MKQAGISRTTLDKFIVSQASRQLLETIAPAVYSHSLTSISSVSSKTSIAKQGASSTSIALYAERAGLDQSGAFFLKNVI